MSVRISNTQIKFKDENGTYQDVNAISPEIPVAKSDTFGIVKPMPGLGTGVANNGGLAVVKPTLDQLKRGANEYNAIVPVLQHASAFYGLAKAAGVDMASSSNAVGEYTDEAKIAIQKMLGIYEAPWELIREDTVTNATEANIEITVDGNGNAFELTDLVLMFETPKQSTSSGKGLYGLIYFYKNETLAVAEYGTAWTQNANENANGIAISIINDHGMCNVTLRSKAETTKGGNLIQFYQEGFMGNRQNTFFDPDFSITSINIFNVTGTGHYRLYGKRKWQ